MISVISVGDGRMTEQDVWNFLKEGEGKRRRLKALEAKKDKIEKDAYSIKAIDYEKSRVSGGMLSDVSDKLIQKEEEKSRIKAEIAEQEAGIYAWETKALRMSRYCDNDTQAALFVERFVNGKSQEEIQKEYHYAERQPYNIYNQAVAAIARNCNE